MTPVTQARVAPVAIASQSLRACFGVGCAHHHRCARYEAVASSETSSETLGTCLSGDAYPMFVEISASN
jgi:hypothetical protein